LRGILDPIKETVMHDHFGPRRWAVALFAILAAVAIGTVTYRAGVSRGLALQPPVAFAPPAAGAPPAAQGAYPYYPYRFYRRRPFGFFGPLLFLFFVFFLLRMVFFFGGGWRRRRWHGDADYWPQRFDEWHQRAHERMKTPPQPPTAS
jgi:hypothetical protein